MHADGKTPFDCRKWSQAETLEAKDHGPGLGSLVPGAHSQGLGFQSAGTLGHC